MTQIDHRLDTLESELHALRRENRRWRVGAVLLALPAAALGGLAAMQNERIPDVIRTNRLEIVDSQGKVVMAAATQAGEGRLDLWNGRGANVIRLGCNPDGGDLIMWNSAGKNVAGLYANGGGVTAELRSGDNQSAMILQSDAESAAIRLLQAGAAQETVALRSTATQSTLTMATPGHTSAISLDASEQGGLIAVADDQGHRAASMSGTGGGAVNVANADGGSASMTVGSDGGSMSINDRLGKRVATLGANGDGGALLSLFDDARKMVGLGSGSGGGLMNLSDGEGRVVLIAGPASDADGGAVSIRSGAGIQIARLGVDILGAGEVAVFNGQGTSKRVLGMGVR